MSKSNKQSLIGSAWWLGEVQVPFALAPSHFPPRGTGEPVTVSTIYKYSTAGIGGVRLRRFKGGGCWCTSVEEIARFQLALTALAEAAP